MTASPENGPPGRTCRSRSQASAKPNSGSDTANQPEQTRPSSRRAHVSEAKYLVRARLTVATVGKLDDLRETGHAVLGVKLRQRLDQPGMVAAEVREDVPDARLGQGLKERFTRRLVALSYAWASEFHGCANYASEPR